MGMETLSSCVFDPKHDPVHEPVYEAVENDLGSVPIGPSALLVEPAVLDELELEALLGGLSLALGARTPWPRMEHSLRPLGCCLEGALL